MPESHSGEPIATQRVPEPDTVHAVTAIHKIRESCASSTRHANRCAPTSHGPNYSEEKLSKRYGGLKPDGNEPDGLRYSSSGRVPPIFFSLAKTDAVSASSCDFTLAAAARLSSGIGT